MYRSVSASRRPVGAIFAILVAIAVMATGALGTASAKEEVCSSGAHTLSHFGDHVYPEMGNGGYKSIHTNVNLVYDAPHNEFLAGNNVELTQLSTQCLTDFSLDFAPQTPDNPEGPGANMHVEKVFVNGQEVPFEFVQPTYPGDPNGQNDPDPLAHQAGQDTPVSATNPLPPACSPETGAAAENGKPCPTRKLVITPTASIPSGEAFTVKIEYSGHPGVYSDGGGEADGWFRSNEPVGDGSFVTTEPVGTEAWMPLNNHPSAKPTYDFNERVTKGRTVVANGELVRPESGELAEENPPDEQFPEGSTTWRWHSPEPIANYLVENSIGNYELLERKSADGITYYEVQGSAITAAQKAKNKEVMDQQEDITHFQERFNGPFPFTTDGVVIGVPKASFEEEMQGKITFNGGQIGLTTFNHENMHQWWGDSVSESNFNETFFKEGMARLSEYLMAARTAATTAGGLDTPAGEAAFDASLAARFHTNYIATGTMWTRAPSNPTPVTLFSTPTTYNRPATAYIALRQILGKDNFAAVLKQVQREFGGSSIHEAQWEAAFAEHLPNQSPACRSRLNQFFTEWFDTEFAAAGSAESLRPQLTGPGLDVSAAGMTFYNADGTCKRVAPPPPVTTATISPNAVEGKVVGPATVTLQATDPNSGIAKTEFKVDGKAFGTYTGPFTVTGFAPHTIEFRSTNGDGTLELAKSVTFTIVKRAAPTTTATVLPTPVEGKVVGPATVTLSVKDNGAGILSTEFSLDEGAFQPYTGPFTVSGFFAHTVEYRSTNGDGEIEPTQTVSFEVVRHQAPTTTATVSPNPVGGNVSGPATVTLLAKDNGGGIASTEFKIDAGAFQTYTGPFAVTGFAPHTVEYRSTSSDGAVEEAKTLTFTVQPRPAPTTTASIQPQPVEGKVAGPAKVSLLAKENGGGGVASTEINVDGVGFQAYPGPVNIGAFGPHTVEFRSTNADGIVETTQTVSFEIVQHLAPVTTATVLPKPDENDNVVGSATVVLAAQGAGADVVETEFKLDDGEFGTYEGPIAVTSFGEHTVEFRSRNSDGAIEETKTVSFTVLAHDPPSTSAKLLPEPGADGKITGPATLVLAATGKGADVTGTEFKLDQGAFQPYLGPVTVATLGAHTVEYRSTNSEGTVEPAHTIGFTILAPPVLPGPPAPQKSKPACADPHLKVAVSHPLRLKKGVATLRKGKAYHYLGSLRCGTSGAAAPAGTVVTVSALKGKSATALPGIVVGDGGKIDTLLQFGSGRTIVFRYAADGESTEAKIRIAVARR